MQAALKSDTIEALERYAGHHIETGGFLRAVLENNLMEAVARADDNNIKVLREICQYVHMGLPSECHGSPEKVKEWLNARAYSSYTCAALRTFAAALRDKLEVEQ